MTSLGNWWRRERRPDAPSPAPVALPAPRPPPTAHLAVRHVSHDVPPRVAPGSVFKVRLALENTGLLSWRATSPDGHHFGLAVFWDGTVVENHPMPRPEIFTYEQVVLHFAVTAPTAPGAHRLVFKMVQYQVAMFEDRGSPALAVDVVVEDQPLDENARLWTTAQRVDAWHYLPTRGLARGASGQLYPVFTKRAQGCHVWDAQGKQYIDYTMGWGSILLGHAHPKVTAAIGAMLDTGSMVSWPQPVEIEVAQMLTEDFPSAEMVCFGKNGSDACTFAVRMARLFTKRKKVLFAGYHGWQDFWVEQLPFERTGVPQRDEPLIHRFAFNDIESFRALLAEHRSDVAAVMIEPSPWKGDGIGFEGDTDAKFLRELAAETRAAGALLIFDEIVTGYRYPGGSVQKAKGVTPDLTCLGKAIASGMPLSAVVGRADVFKDALPRAFYAATFHGEAYSFAAARAAIEVYRSEPVAQHVWDYGVRMRDAIHALLRQFNVTAELKGPPFRMSTMFGRPDLSERQLERTLYHQELLKRGVLTYSGVMLPCYAHDEVALKATLEAVGQALEVTAKAAKLGNWDDVLEIPPLIDL